jgi:hypothetical protein
VKPCLAIAANFLRELTRERSSTFFILLMVGLGLLLPHLAGQAPSLRAQLQLTVNYGLGLPIFLVSLATIVMSAGAVAGEVETRQLQTVATKPCSSWQFVLGKLVGVLAASGALLALLFAAFAINVIWILSTSGATVEERDVALQRFLSPRVGFFPDVPPVDESALRSQVDRLKSDPKVARGKTPKELEAQARRILRSSRIPPGKSAEIVFTGLEPGVKSREDLRRGKAPPEQIILRYELQWYPPGGAPQVSCAWEAGSGEARFAETQRPSRGVPQELAVPASAVSPSGTLRLLVKNTEPSDSGITLLLDPSAVEALRVQGSFAPNLLKGFGLCFAQCVLLAAVGILGSSAFTFPTACLLGLLVYFTGLSAGFLRETFELETSGLIAGTYQQIASAASKVGQKLLDVFPDLSRLDPVGLISMGRNVRLEDLWEGVFWTAGTKAALVILLAGWILGRRELARGER